MSNLRDRLADLRGFLGVPQSEMGKKMKVSPSVYQKYESSVSNTVPGADKLSYLIGSVPKLSPRWLLTGEGPMLEEDQGVEDNTEFARLPRWNVSASAGNGLDVDEEFVIDYLAIKEDYLKRKGISKDHSGFIKADGDSMSPAIQSGDLMLVDMSQKSIQDGKIYVIRNDRSISVKRLIKTIDGVLVISENKDYPVIEFKDTDTDRFEIIGRVFLIERDM